MATDAVTDVVVEARGDVSPAEREYAQMKIGRLRGLVPGPVLFARVALTTHADAARERPASAKGSLDVNGRSVRAHVAAGTMLEAIDLLEARLRERLERFAHHQESKHLRLRGSDDHEWRHGDRETSRPPYFPRAAEERQIVSTKTFAVDEMTPDEAAFDLELLDHDFYLFKNLETGEDNVVARARRIRVPALRAVGDVCAHRDCSTDRAQCHASPDHDDRAGHRGRSSSRGFGSSSSSPPTTGADGCSTTATTVTTGSSGR